MEGRRCGRRRGLGQTLPLSRSAPSAGTLASDPRPPAWGETHSCAVSPSPPPPPGRGAVLPQRREPQQRTAAGWAVSYLQATVRQAPRTQDSEASSSECVKHAGCPCVLRISRRTVSASQPWACFGPRALQPLRRAVWWFL